MQEIACKPAAIFCEPRFFWKKKNHFVCMASLLYLKEMRWNKIWFTVFAEHLQAARKKCSKTHGSQVEMCQIFCSSSMLVVHCCSLFMLLPLALFFASNNLPKFTHLVTTLFVLRSTTKQWRKNYDSRLFYFWKSTHKY